MVLPKMQLSAYLTLLFFIAKSQELYILILNIYTDSKKMGQFDDELLTFGATGAKQEAL